jgi:hypothetical protein
MSKNNNQKPDDDEVEIVHRVNRLKQKVHESPAEQAEGFIDSTMVRKAQAVIDNSHEKYTAEAKSSLGEIVAAWAVLKSGKSKDVKKDVDHLCRLSNRVKDMASTYGYDLMSYFGESLRDFCEKLDVSKQPHCVIVQAHIDVMWVAFNEKLKGEHGQKAEELKMIVNKAIEKFS